MQLLSVVQLNLFCAGGATALEGALQRGEAGVIAPSPSTTFSGGNAKLLTGASFRGELLLIRDCQIVEQCSDMQAFAWPGQPMTFISLMSKLEDGRR